jgi:flagella basal body P-ring formation protein FlgA
MLPLLLLALAAPPPAEVAAPPALLDVEVPLPERLAEAALAYAEAEAAKLPGSYRIRLLQPPVAPRIPRGEPSVEVSHLSKREPCGRFFVAMKVMAEGRLAGYARVELEGSWTGTLLKAKEDLRRKSIPASGQVEDAPFEGQPPAGALSVLPEGYRLRQPVQAGRFITRADLEPIPLVVAGDRVKLTAVYESLSISTEGVARNSAALGERVRVELMGSRKLVQAQASGEGQVRLEGFEHRK